jgi:hypothetical protein
LSIQYLPPISALALYWILDCFGTCFVKKSVKKRAFNQQQGGVRAGLFPKRLWGAISAKIPRNHTAKGGTVFIVAIRKGFQ